MKDHKTVNPDEIKDFILDAYQIKQFVHSCAMTKAMRRYAEMQPESVVSQLKGFITSLEGQVEAIQKKFFLMGFQAGVDFMKANNNPGHTEIIINALR